MCLYSTCTAMTGPHGTEQKQDCRLSICTHKLRAPRSLLCLRVAKGDLPVGLMR